MTTLDVRLHLDAVIDVEPHQVQAVRERIQRLLEELVGGLEDYGVEWGSSEFYARPRAQEVGACAQ